MLLFHIGHYYELLDVVEVYHELMDFFFPERHLRVFKYSKVFYIIEYKWWRFIGSFHSINFSFFICINFE